jgi:hypothetical protein
MIFKSEANPIGLVYAISKFEDKINDLKRKWDEIIKENPNIWYKSWGIKKINLNLATNFILECLDELIVCVDGLLQFGPDKKATVLNGIDKIYDYVLREGLPIWLRPFAAPVKNYIIYVLISNSIDWIVNKYKKGQWAKTNK